MLAQLSKYAGLSAKVKVMTGHLLKPGDYEELLSKSSVQDIAAYLKNHTEYKNVLSEISESNIHRGQLEQLLQHASEQGFIRLTNFLSNTDKRFMKMHILREEIELLKKLLRMAAIEEIPPEEVQVNPYYLKNFTIEPYRLMQAANMTAFSEGLKDTPYYEVLVPLLHETPLDIFKIEMVLDGYYFRTLYNTAEKFIGKADKAAVRRTVGSDIDMLNILWVLRCKMFFSLPAELILTYLLPVHYRIKKEQLIAMAESPTVDGAKAILHDTPYDNLLDSDSIYMEQAYQRKSVEIMKKAADLTPFSLLSALYYQRMKEIEITNIVKIIEGLRYHVDKEEIRKFLIGNGGEKLGS